MNLAFWRTKAVAPPAAPRPPAWAEPLPRAPAGYEGQARALLDNPVAARALRLVAEGAGGAPLVANPPGHPALGLLASCGWGASGPGLIETLAAQLLLHGNAFVETALGADGRPAALFALRPERVSIETDAAGWPVAHVHRAGARSVRHPVGPEGLLHIRSFHPLDDQRGAGCLAAAAGSIAAHDAAARWNRALLDNAARPSGALVYAPGDGSSFSPEQFARLREELDRGFAGANNAGRPLLLDGGMAWQAMALSPAEMDFARLKDGAAREIALALGVPPLLLGMPGDNTHANYREANVALWRLTLLPLLARILSALSAHLGRWWPGLVLSVDRDAIPALAEDRERLWGQVVAADFLSADEKRAILGLEAHA